MFNEIHNSSDINGIKLAFIRSDKVSVYPCGRRRSLVDTDSNNQQDQYYIPFDPEARLNTEANNRKHSSLNGYTQTYIKDEEWNNESFIIALDGYLFKIALDSADIKSFGNKLFEKLNISTDGSIYANILIEDTPLFSNKFESCHTGVLRNQSGSLNDTRGEAYIDLLTTAASSNANNSEEILKNSENYYFSGLSFSTKPLTAVINSEIDINATRSTASISGSRSKRVVSLRVLDLKITSEKQANNTYKNVLDTVSLHLPACLPKIAHGDTSNSVEVDTLIVKNIKKDDIAVPSLNVVETATKTYQLQFKLN